MSGERLVGQRRRSSAQQLAGRRRGRGAAAAGLVELVGPGHDRLARPARDRRRASPRPTRRKLAVGQPATITFPALTNTEVAGKVTAVSSTSTVVSNVVTYDATIALVNPPAEVKEGMTAR